MWDKKTDTSHWQEDSWSRREFLHRSGLGFGGMALAHLLQAQPAAGSASSSGSPDLLPRQPISGRRPAP